MSSIFDSLGNTFNSLLGPQSSIGSSIGHLLGFDQRSQLLSPLPASVPFNPTQSSSSKIGVNLPNYDDLAVRNQSANLDSILSSMGGGGYGGGNYSSAPGGDISSILASIQKAGQDAMSKIQDVQQQQYKQLQTAVTSYKSAHPFSYDDYLAGTATAQAKEQVDPYYQETLGNYLSGVTNKINRSNTDMRNVLDELNNSADNYTQQNKFQLGSALQKTQEQYGENGLYNSGARAQGEGQIQTGAGLDLAGFLDRNNAAQRQATSQHGFDIADIINGSNQFQRDLGRNQFTAEQTRAADITKNAAQNYVSGFQATLPPQLQASSGFDIFKQLGIPYN